MQLCIGKIIQLTVLQLGGHIPRKHWQFGNIPKHLDGGRHTGTQSREVQSPCCSSRSLELK